MASVGMDSAGMDTDAMANSAPTASAAAAWRSSLIQLAFAWVVILTTFWRDVVDMIGIWWNVSTYNHILLVPLILGWLVMQRQEQLAKIAPTSWAGGLLPMAGAVCLWILGEAGGFNFFRHLALIILLQSSVLTILGWRVSLALLFPLFYGFFLVPVGEELVPALQILTADMSMVMLGWAGIPAHLEGVFISTPTGYFEVAEACSGVKFLIAMLAYGVLVANVCFKSWTRRLAFVALCIVVPIVANGIRAWGTIYIAHHSTNDFAAGFDHIFYGWIFFAIVLIIVMALGWRFFDRTVTEPFLDDEMVSSLSQNAGLNGTKPSPVLAAAAVLIVLPLIWSIFSNGAPADIETDIGMPDVSGWVVTEYAPFTAWQPRADGANAEILGRYTNGKATVDLFVAVYDGQDDERDISGYGQGPLDPESAWAWASDAAPVANGQSMKMLAPGPVGREVITFYIIGNTITGSNLRVKLETMKARILGQPLPAAMIILSAERRDGRSTRTALDSFLVDAGGIEGLARKFDIAVADKAQ